VSFQHIFGDSSALIREHTGVDEESGWSVDNVIFYNLIQSASDNPGTSTSTSYAD